LSLLSELPLKQSARVVQIQHDPAGHWRKLSALGLVPGVQIVLVQRFPTFVVQVGHSLVAIDRHLASLVQVEPLGC